MSFGTPEQDAYRRRGAGVAWPCRSSTARMGRCRGLGGLACLGSDAVVVVCLPACSLVLPPPGT